MNRTGSLTSIQTVQTVRENWKDIRPSENKFVKSISLLKCAVNRLGNHLKNCKVSSIEQNLLLKIFSALD
jgi:hypothetical protein